MPKINYYEEIVRKDGSRYFVSQRKCPFQRFEKCIGEQCAIFSITGFRDNKGIEKDFGECALVKLPAFLIDLKEALTVINLEALTGKGKN